MTMNYSKKTQIKTQIELQIRTLLYDKAFALILVEYFNYSNIFLVENVIKFLEHIKINNHAIKLKKSKQTLFESIYNSKSVELKILKTYIEINLANSFIQLSKSSAKMLIFLDRKPNNSFKLYVDYCDFNNFIIKNLYLLFLINKLLD